MTQISHKRNSAIAGGAILLAATAPALFVLKSDSGSASGNDDLQNAFAQQVSNVQIQSASIEDRISLPPSIRSFFDSEALRPHGRYLLAGLEDDFNLAGQGSTVELVRSYADTLIQSGLDSKEVQRVLWSFFSQGYFDIGECSVVAAELRALFPDSQVFADLAEQYESSSELPPGALGVTWISGAADPFGGDVLGQRRYEQENDAWLPESGSDLPAQFSVFHARVQSDEYAQRGLQGLAVKGEIRYWPASADFDSAPAGTQAFNIDFDADPQGRTREQIFDIELPSELKQYSSPIAAQIVYSVAPILLEQEAEVDVPQWSHWGQNWMMIHPISEEELLSAGNTNDPTRIVTHRIDPAGPEGAALEFPNLVHSIPTHQAHFSTVWKKDMFRRRALEAQAAERKEQSFQGRSIDQLTLVATSSAAGLSTEQRQLVLDPENEYIVYIGATWCVPCKLRAPELQRYIDRLEEKGSELTVLRLSIDTDPQRFEKALGGLYPDGVLSNDQFRDFGLGSVPAYFRVKDGRVAEYGNLTKWDLARWHEELGEH